MSEITKKDFIADKNKLASGRYAVAVTLASTIGVCAVIVSIGLVIHGKDNYFRLLSEYFQLAKEILGFYLGMKVGEIVAKAKEKPNGL
jgi:hypothetical protein